jgi:putative membrane protein
MVIARTATMSRRSRQTAATNAARTLTMVALAAGVPECLAHAGDPAAPTWSFQAWVVTSLLLALGLYLHGLFALWRAAAPGRGIGFGAAACFFGGWLAAALALVSPLDTLAADLFWVHMVQHEVLMLVAAPLLVLGRPLAVWSWALPPDAVRALAGPARSPLVRDAWGALTAPLGAWLAHAAVLWLWHVPAFFNAAAASAGWHAAQHLSFFGTALAFWWVCVGAGRQARGGGVLCLLTTMMHTGALGALLTLSGTAWYSNNAVRWGWTALADQQLGGLIMWVPAGAVYLSAGLALFARWLGAAQRARA